MLSTLQYRLDHLHIAILFQVQHVRVESMNRVWIRSGIGIGSGNAQHICSRIGTLARFGSNDEEGGPGLGLLGDIGEAGDRPRPRACSRLGYFGDTFPENSCDTLRADATLFGL